MNDLIYRDETGQLRDYDSYQENVFRHHAVRYSVVFSANKGRTNRNLYATYPEAMLIALARINELNDGINRVNLYIVSDFETDVLVEVGRYEKFLKIYNELTGQQLRMPPQYPVPKIYVSPSKQKRKKR